MYIRPSSTSSFMKNNSHGTMRLPQKHCPATHLTHLVGSIVAWRCAEDIFVYTVCASVYINVCIYIYIHIYIVPRDDWGILPKSWSYQPVVTARHESQSGRWKLWPRHQRRVWSCRLEVGEGKNPTWSGHISSQDMRCGVSPISAWIPCRVRHVVRRSNPQSHGPKKRHWPSQKGSCLVL